MGAVKRDAKAETEFAILIGAVFGVAEVFIEKFLHRIEGGCAFGELLGHIGGLWGRGLELVVDFDHGLEIAFDGLPLLVCGIGKELGGLHAFPPDDEPIDEGHVALDALV